MLSGIKVFSPILLLLLLFDLHDMRVGICILPDSCDLPGHLHAGPPASDMEPVVLDLLRHVDWRETADTGEMVFEVPVEGLEPARHFHPCLAIAIQEDVSVIDVHALAALHAGV